MYSLLLRKALPFALTFVLGSLVGGLFKSIGIGGPSAGNARAFRYSYGGRHSCRMRFQRRNLVAESKPLRITFKPDARWPRGLEAEDTAYEPVRVSVTFGADGKVSAVTPEGGCFSDSAVARLQPVKDAVERAALMIQFEPETVDGIPVAVTREVEIRFMDE